MAESFVSFLLDNLGQLIIQEAVLLRGVKSEVTSLHDELKLINNFLENSKGKRETVKDLVAQIHDVANKAKDVVDTFFISMAKHKKRKMFAKFWYGYQHVSMLHNVAVEVKRVNNEITKIYANKEKYGINDIGSAVEDSNRHSADVDSRRRRVEEHNVVGFHNDATLVIRQLISQENRNLHVVSIMGMGGLGKSTLAKSIYNNDFIKQHFDCRVWVYVSREYQSREVLLNILQRVAPSTTRAEISGMGGDDEILVEELRKCLEKEKYLIVLDSVWETKVWDGIKGAFPDSSGNGSRVLVTTRNKEVAFYTSSDTPYSLPFLNEEESWALFKSRAFGDKLCPSDLEIPGRKIANECGGLPLAIVAAVDHLARRERSRRTWSKMADNVSLYLTREPENCLDILALSYKEIPKDLRRLRYCFLYFGVFPEYSEISTKQLFRMWIAEGFVEKEKGIKIEDIAEDYLEQLLDQSLIMVVKRRNDGSIKSCRIHDLLRTFCIAEGVRENLFTVHNEEVFDSQPVNINKNRPRRLSIHCNASRYLSSIPCNTKRVHSLLYFGVEDMLDAQQLRLLYQVFLCLRVLDLGSTIILSMPSQVKKLIHLRYLRMDSPTLTEIPSSISSLPSLETLDLRKSSVTFTENFWEMQRLRHLFVSGASGLPTSHRQSDVKTMWNLQTFSTVSPQILNALDFDQVFPNVKKLGLHSPNSHPIFIDMSKFKSVQNLKIIESCFLSSSLPFYILSHLTKITLLETQLFSTDFEILEDLPKLQVLKLLRNSMFPIDLCIKEGGFPQLELLHMEELNVQKLTIKSQALNSLKHISITKCASLNHVEAKSCSYKLEQILHSLGEHIVYEF